jgi:predicted nucleic acid-binding Zn ribbon protein
MQEMVKCAGCGAMVPPQKAFCSNCGAPMEAEEQQREKRGIENMAQTVIGFSLDQTLVQSKPTPPPEVKPPAPEVKPLSLDEPSIPPTPIVAMPAPIVAPAPATGKGSKIVLIIVGGLILLFLLLVLLVAGLSFSGVLDSLLR